ncbi:MAG: hypothetical protein U0W24_08060 [Bacteroidales bacterium]
MIITKSSTIEEIINESSEFVDFLFKKSIRCIRCGEPIWGTIEEAALQKGYNDEQITHLIEEMNTLLVKQ